MSFTRIVAALLLASLPALGADRPLTDEDIVRRVITGESSAAIIELIRTSESDFDLSDEMVEEMKIAGVPDAVIRAMKARHLELNPPAEPEPVEIELPKLPALVVHLKVNKPPVLPKLVSEKFAELAGLPSDEDGRRIQSVALFVACTTATHVPDYWRGKSPLGRDFLSAPRHRMLLFQPVTEPDTVKLTLPESVRIDLMTGEPHDLVFGAAIQAGGRYLAVAQHKLDNLTLQEGDTHKAMEVVQGMAKTLDVKIREIEYVPQPAD